MKTSNLISVATLLGVLSACGGGGGDGSPIPPPPPPPVTATTLVYTPPSGGSYQMVRNAGSTPTHLILDLVGPAGTSGRGIGFYLNADTGRITWSKVSGSDAELVQNGAFNLGSGVLALKAKVNGNELQAGVYQKGTSAPAIAFGSTVVLARVAMDLKSGLTPGAVSFSAVPNKAMLLPDVGAATPGNISVSVGSLTAQ